jgi:N-acetyl-anhydromuramyl-L-alanine amidase AmpD
MARLSFLRLSVYAIACCCTGMVLVGCASNPNASSNLPGKVGAGPAIDREPAKAPVQVAQVDRPKTPVRVKDFGAIPSSWIPLARAEKRDWNWIVIHHSATSVGSAKRFDRDHKAKGWDELGYHFVIGNGTDGVGDGEVEVGSRWPMQKHGAHAKTPDNKFNDHGIGICLVGNFEETRPTARQMQSLTRLVAYLADKHGVRQTDIITHKMTGKSTDCPGRNLDLAAVRAGAAKQRTALVEEDATQPKPGDELMLSAR